jgi:prepilin-type N-terminal cleavage/methylation domain-containing protein
LPIVCGTLRRALDAEQLGKESCKHKGFSLLELMVVLCVAFIAATMVLPTATTAIRGVRLSSSGASYADLLQQARVRAVRDDRYYTVIATAAVGSNPATAFIDIAGTGAYAQGDPLMVFAQGVTPRPFASGPSLSNLESQFLPPGAASIASVNTTAAGPTFGPRGLPCSPVTNAGYTTCPFITPTSYINYMQETQGGIWEAVTVTPAGRIREWKYNGTSWTPLN